MTTSAKFPVHPDTEHRAGDIRAADAWRDAFVGARRQPRHRFDVSFRRSTSASAALRTARHVGRGLGRMARCPVPWFAVAEMAAGHDGYGLHVLVWTPRHVPPVAVRHRWTEASGGSVEQVRLWTRQDPGPCPDDDHQVRPLKAGVGYALKRYHHADTEWAASPRLLRRIGARAATSN